jgi:hypothetical protein
MDSGPARAPSYLKHPAARPIMNRTTPLLALASLFLVARGMPAEEPARPDAGKLPPAVKRAIEFNKDVQPLLARACVSCHGPEKQRGGLRLDDGDAAGKGGNSGAILKPGDAAASRLLFIVAGLDAETKMPPEGKKPLTADEVGVLRAWVEQGAVWPKNTAAATVVKSAHWAFQPIRSPEPSAVKNTSWVRNPIDHFVLARLEKEGLTPSPAADSVTLVRRLYLDLTGLPPSPADVDEFVKDTQPGAYERLVERVLASPHYGERWARHWLDMARYADSDGFEKDTGRPHAWRFRHWVLEAINRDLPFDQFTVEQLAGDLLPGATTEQKVATGFHRNTLTNREGGVDREQFRVEQVVDRVNTTAKVWMGLTLGCAQCHDHKYDPLSQREYYQFLSFFNSDVETDIPAPVPAEDAGYAARKAEHEKKRAELLAAVAAYTKDKLPAALAKWEDGLTLAQLRALPPAVGAALLVEPAKRNAAQQKQVADHHAKLDAKLVQLNKAVADHQKAAPQPTMAQTMALGAARKTHVMIRGDFLRPGVEVSPGTPAVLPPLPSGATANRLALAKWVVSGDNPLTGRVLVNWVWQRYFGRGLVATLEDFGTQGEKPSHPELLDWLAAEVVRRKWSLKELHRLIVTSATYRQSSHVRPELATRDPINVLLARQSRLRLEAEIVRDVSLAASGLLTRKVGGPSVRPPQPAGISELTYAGAAKWVESKGPDRYRRGLYTWFQRTSPYPMLLTFDAPDSNVCAVRRERSNTPLQALTLMNDTTFAECGQALGRRVTSETPGADNAARIRHAFRVCLAREPDSRELSVLERLYGELLAEAKAKPEGAVKLAGTPSAGTVDVAETAAWVALARTLLNLDEFVTRE